MSVMAAHFVELREDKTLDVCVVRLALHSVPGTCCNDRLLYQSDDAETKASTSRARCHLVFVTPSTCHAPTPQGPDRNGVSMFVGVPLVHHALNR